MLSPRTETILKSIVTHYINRATPVPSQLIAEDPALGGISSATIRNEMAQLEQLGYIIRPHTSAGSVPSDKGYRYYVESLRDVRLSEAEQRLISHLFHQVEKETEQWLSLTATLLARLVKNVAVVTMPKPADCKFKHLELVSLQDTLALIVLVLHGAKIKQRLITFNEAVHQPSLTAISNKLNDAYSGLNRHQIRAKEIELTPLEQQIVDYLTEMMQAEDEQEYDEPYLDGLHFMLNQPEFAHTERMQPLMELVEQRSLLKAIIPAQMKRHTVQVIIGKENKAKAIQNYSVVISQYGLPEEAEGTIGVVGPTRMPYSHTIPTVGYLSSVLTELMTGLYGKVTSPRTA